MDIENRSEVQHFLTPESINYTSVGDESLVGGSSKLNQNLHNFGLQDGGNMFSRENKSNIDGSSILKNDDMCPICGDEASKYAHYGGRSCQSCRAFFRRSVKKHRG